MKKNIENEKNVMQFKMPKIFIFITTCFEVEREKEEFPILSNS